MPVGCEFLRSIILLDVRHEPAVGLVHPIVVGSDLLGWIVETRCSCIGIRTEPRVIHILKVLVFLATDRTSAIRKFATSLIWFVKSICRTISSRFPAATYGSSVSRCIHELLALSADTSDASCVLIID